MRNLLYIAALFCATSAVAMDVTMEINPRVLRLGESAMGKITLHDAPGAPPPRLPALSGFTVESIGREQSYSFNNGERSSQVSYNFRITPLAAGDFQIGPFQYDTGSGVINIPAIALQVLARGDPATGSHAQHLDELMFVTVTANPDVIYSHQAFDLVLNLYTQPGLNLNRNVSLSNFDTTGLSLTPFEEQSPTREAINGTLYDVRHFRTRATAIASGTFPLQPHLQVNVIVPNDNRTRRRDPFSEDDFFAGFFNRVETRPQTVESKPFALQIRELPSEGRPTSFSGAVGQFSFDVSAKPLQAKVGDPITLTLRIQGRGNMDAVSAPSFAIPDSFRSYDARLVDQQPNAGLKVFEQVLIPRNASVSEIPAVSFSYFDPERQRYETLVRGPFPLTLSAAGAASSAAVIQSPNPATPAPTKPLGHDLVYLKHAPKHWQQKTTPTPQATAIRLAVNTLPALALIAIFGYVRRREHAERNPLEILRRQAPRSARSALARSGALAKKGDVHGAAQALSDALNQFFGPLLNLPPGQLSADVVCQRMRSNGLSEAQCAALHEVFSVCDHLRYSGSSAADKSADSTRDLERITLQLADLLPACQKVSK